jgi:hypothetical protein
MLSPQAKHPRAKRLVRDPDGRLVTSGFAGGSFAAPQDDDDLWPE